MSYVRQMVVARQGKNNKVVERRNFSTPTWASLTSQENLKGGELVNILTNELVRFNASLVGFVSLFNSAVMAVVYGVFLALTSWQMTLASILVVGLAALPLKSVYKKTADASKNATKANSDATEYFVQVGSCKVIRLSREDAEIKRMQNFTTNQYNILCSRAFMAITAAVIEPVILGLVFFLFMLRLCYWKFRWLTLRYSSLLLCV